MGLSIRSTLGHLVCLALLHQTAPAVAQGGDRAAAEALFQKGRAAMASADYPAACAAFEESNRLDPAPGTMANLATCEEGRGRLAAAWQWLERAATTLAPGDPRLPLVGERASGLKARLPLLTLRLEPGSPPDTKVVRDSVELRSVSLGMALPLDPGTHEVLVVAPGRATKRYSVDLREKDQKELVVAAGPEVASQGVAGGSGAPAGSPKTERGPDVRPRSSGGDTRTLGYVVGGVGVAGIGTALVFGGLVLGEKSTVASHCEPGPRTCDPTGLDAVSAGRTFSTVSTVSFAVGAAATAVGAYFILSSDDEPEASVGATMLPGGAEVRMARRF